MSKALIAPTLLAVVLWAIPAHAQVPSTPLCTTEQVDATGARAAGPCVAEPAAGGARPFVLGRHEKPASPSFFTRTSVHLGDVPVFKSESHAVKLRFTLAGTPPTAQPASVLASFPPAPTLFTVHVDVVGLP